MGEVDSDRVVVGECAAVKGAYSIVAGNAAYVRVQIYAESVCVFSAAFAAFHLCGYGVAVADSREKVAVSFVSRAVYEVNPVGVAVCACNVEIVPLEHDPEFAAVYAVGCGIANAVYYERVVFKEAVAAVVGSHKSVAIVLAHLVVGARRYIFAAADRRNVELGVVYSVKAPVFPGAALCLVQNAVCGTGRGFELKHAVFYARIVPRRAVIEVPDEDARRGVAVCDSLFAAAYFVFFGSAVVFRIALVLGAHIVVAIQHSGNRRIVAVQFLLLAHGVEKVYDFYYNLNDLETALDPFERRPAQIDLRAVLGVLGGLRKLRGVLLALFGVLRIGARGAQERECRRSKHFCRK